MREVVTAIGTPNIALVKYWGKRDFKLNLPTNSSVSITLDESLNTKTSILFSEKLKEDKLYINGVLSVNKTKTEKTEFITGVIDYMRTLAKTRKRALIVSENSFPTGAGLASSAAGAATLVYAVSKALGLGISKRELSMIARRVSGSGCRSVLGGFVLWKKGIRADGHDSYAQLVADEKYWPEVIDIITKVSGSTKKVSSGEGHNLTTKTSQLYKSRPEIAERNVDGIINAIRQRNFGRLAEITMRDSNSMHATMLDAWPPIIYLNDTSRDIIYMVDELNKREGTTIAAYTFDAGPNAQLITLAKHKNKVINTIKGLVGSKNIIIARQGSGPRLLPDSESLIDDDRMVPLRHV